MLYTIIGIALITVAICLLLKKTNQEFSMASSLIAGIIIFSLIIVNFTPVMDFVNIIISKYNLNSEYITVVIKALGICYITQLASDCCKDSGYEVLSTKVELGGKLAIILVSLPLFENLLNVVNDLIMIGN